MTRLSRRRVLGAVAAGSLVGVSGCAGLLGGDSGTPSPSRDDWVPTMSARPRPDRGYAVATYDFDRWFDRRTAIEPETFSTVVPRNIRQRVRMETDSTLEQTSFLTIISYGDLRATVIGGAFEAKTNRSYYENRKFRKTGSKSGLTLYKAKSSEPRQPFDLVGVTDGVVIGVEGGRESFSAEGFIDKFATIGGSDDKLFESNRYAKELDDELGGAIRKTVTLLPEEEGFGRQPVEKKFEKQVARAEAVTAAGKTTTKTILYRFEDGAETPAREIQEWLNEDDYDNPLREHSDVTIRPRGSLVVARGKITEPQR